VAPSVLSLVERESVTSLAYKHSLFKSHHSIFGMSAIHWKIQPLFIVNKQYFIRLGVHAMGHDIRSVFTPAVASIMQRTLHRNLLRTLKAEERFDGT
jgi:hypothetical protein